MSSARLRSIPRNQNTRMLSDLYISGLRLDRQRLGEAEDRYFLSIPAIQNLETLDFHSRITFFVGENGTGKSTLLEAIAVKYGFNPEGGSPNFSFSTRETHSPLHQCLVLSKGIRRPQNGFFLRAESFYNVASEVDRLAEAAPGGDEFLEGYGGHLHEKSHGESFLSLVMNRFNGRGLYILDEPEAALSPSRQMSLLKLIYDLSTQGAQFIIATHSPILMALPGAELYALEQHSIRLVSYEETEHYTVMRQFLNHPEGMLRELGIEPRQDPRE